MIKMINRNIQMNYNGALECIDYVQGSNALEIQLNLIDYTIPTGATGATIVVPPTEQARTVPTAISGNTIIISPTAGTFTELGFNKMQVSIVAEGKTLVTFIYNVNVKENLTGTPSIPSPEVDPLLTQILNIASSMQEATEEAEQATTNANNATAEVEQAIQAVNTATANAVTATNNANTATTNANNATAQLEQALSDVGSAVDEAETATANANTATSNANTAASRANTATNNANTATNNANSAASSANSAATNANNAAAAIQTIINADYIVSRTVYNNWIIYKYNSGFVVAFYHATASAVYVAVAGSTGFVTYKNEIQLPSGVNVTGIIPQVAQSPSATRPTAQGTWQVSNNVLTVYTLRDIQQAWTADINIIIFGTWK